MCLLPTTHTRRSGHEINSASFTFQGAGSAGWSAGFFRHSSLCTDAKGTFTLTHKVRWGTAVLPAGSYAFSVDTQSWPARVMVHEVGGSTSAIILPQTFSDEKLSGENTLVLRHEGGESVVSRLTLAQCRPGAGIWLREGHNCCRNGHSGTHRRISTGQVVILRKRPQNLVARFRILIAPLLHWSLAFGRWSLARQKNQPRTLPISMDKIPFIPEFDRGDR